MPSINKLQKLLVNNGLIIKSMYTIGKLCIYMEVLCIDNANTFILYIPSKYKIKVNEEDKDSYSLTLFKIDESDDTLNKLVGKLTNSHMENLYNEIDMPIDITSKDMIHKLEEKYKKIITIEDIDRDDIKSVTDMYRQINRLKYCVQNISYKICLKYKNYLICLVDNDIYTFVIKDYKGKEQFNMYVIVDIKTLYENINKIQNIICNIQDSIYDVLNKNQTSHTKILKRLLETNNNIDYIYSVLSKKKNEYDIYISELEKSLKTINIADKKILENINGLDNNNTDNNSIYSDIEKSHILSKYRTELDSVNNIRRDIIENILKIKNKKEDVFLCLDKLFFDNNVMLDMVFKNLNKTYEYIRN